jgi:hypothetical protein
LPEDFQIEQLKQVAENHLSLSELTESANKYRKIEKIKKTFRNLTNTSSWNEATQYFPVYTSLQRLESFCHFSFQKSTTDQL